MVHKRPLADYMKPVHDDDCGIHRNDSMTALAEHTVNQVMGEPKCDCGLDDAKKRINHNEIDIQCQQHYGRASVCRLVQLRHRPGIKNGWQPPRWVCENCRSHMPGQFRYCGQEQFDLHLALAEGVVA